MYQQVHKIKMSNFLFKEKWPKPLKFLWQVYMFWRVYEIHTRKMALKI